MTIMTIQQRNPVVDRVSIETDIPSKPSPPLHRLFDTWIVVL